MDEPTDRPTSLEIRGAQNDQSRGLQNGRRDMTTQHGTDRVVLGQPEGYLAASDSDGSRKRDHFAVLNATKARETPHAS
jgi:hypothetical protein